MDVEDTGSQTRATDKREEDNKAKQWGHHGWEMDGGRERQRQKMEKGGARAGEKKDRMGQKMKMETEKAKENVGLRALKV